MVNVGMVAHVARGHKGDGGNEPPNGNPNRILHACESSQPKRRSKGKNINLYDKFSKNNKQKLPIEVDDEENQYRFVGDNQSVFVRCISNEVARMVPFHFASWEFVPHHYKRGLYPVISNYFNLDRFKGTDDWEGIKLGIRAECANAYRNRKRRCKAHFERVGGYEDTARARSHPPEGVSPEAWERLINDLYLDPKYKDRCLRNKANRAKQPFKSSHGSQSYAQKRHLNAKKTGKPGHIEVWKRAHYKEGCG